MTAQREPIDLVLYFVGFLLAWNVLGALRSRRYRVIVRGIRARHVAAGALILGVTAATAVLLISSGGVLSLGWWGLLGGRGSAALLSTDHTAHSLVPFVAVAGLALIAPLAALREERWFRRGAERWSWTRRCAKSLGFGLSHLLLGIPVGAALAIAVAGGGFQVAYAAGYAPRRSRHDAVQRATRVHLAYNLIALAFVGGAILMART